MIVIISARISVLNRLRGNVSENGVSSCSQQSDITTIFQGANDVILASTDVIEEFAISVYFPTAQHRNVGNLRKL